jgi:hypothetical protein
MPTIVPLTPEAEWLPAFVDLADWELPFVPTLVLAPHPDDETLGAGGLIVKLSKAGVPVTIVAITDGENAYADTHGLGDIRVLEQTEAIRRLGVPERMIHRLHLPDRMSQTMRTSSSKCSYRLSPRTCTLSHHGSGTFIPITRQRGEQQRGLLNGRTYLSPTISFGPGTAASRACLTDFRS